MNELFEEKMKVVLGLIRTNNTGDEALKFTQAAYNLAQAHNIATMIPYRETEQTESKAKGKQGGNA